MTLTAAVPTAAPPSRLRAGVGFAMLSAAAVGGGWLFVALDRATGQITGAGSTVSTSGTTAGQGLWILVPALTAIVLRLVVRDGAGPLGLTPRFPHPVRWLAFAAAAFPVAVAVCVAAALTTGAAAFSLTPSAGKPSLPAALASTLGFLVVKNLLEELVFRGYGTRTAAALGLPGVVPHVLVGLVWGLWHIPLYAVWMAPADLDATTTLPFAWYLPAFLAGTVALAVLYGEMRLWTGSIWPGVVLHTVSNALSTPLLVDGHLRYRGHGDLLFGIAPGSLASVLLFGGAGLYLHRRRVRQVPKRQ
ncbi:CPBP family intramembrane glutamic endopeptidase [Microbispora sp. NPDC046933]|uniref:CPBP family intramembrane glutamic endopeptidase n=1 Tax=Microbispora sp. NPDC046933 TaxID=3155618 RepID=UPI0033F72C06